MKALSEPRLSYETRLKIAQACEPVVRMIQSKQVKVEVKVEKPKESK